MGKFALMLKKEQEAEEKRKAQGVTYPTEQKVIAPSKGAANAAPIITWKQDGEVRVKASDPALANQSKISKMEEVTTHPDFVEISVRGGTKWKQDKGKADSLLRDPGYRKFQDYVKKNNFAGTLEGISGMQLMLGENNDRYMPQGVWTPKQNNVFRYYYQMNPDYAKEYAAAINDEYKRANEEKLADWAVKNQVVAEAGAWIMDRIAPAETMDTELTYAQTGKLPYTTQVTPGRYSAIVRDVIRNDMDETSGDRVVGTVGTAIRDAANSAYYGYLEKIGGPLGMASGAAESYSSDYNNALYDALSRGATEEEAIQYARKMGGVSAFGTLTSGLINENLSKPENVRKSMIREAVSSVAGETINQYMRNIIDYTDMGEQSLYNTLVNNYISVGYSEMQAQNMALQSIGKSGVNNVLDSLYGGIAYGLGRSDNSLKRSLFK